MAVDAGSAVGYLDIDISGFSTGLKTAQSEANKASDNIAKKIGGSLDTVGSKMSAIGGFVTAGITMPIATAVTESVKQFANLEQSIGGVETLFKGSAQTVISSAETAYKRAGVDANNYMEQVTSFSATLLQSLGGDTKKAADYADRAIVDMSDNANKMGTSIETISQTYQSLARGNYAMLDNLKLGYGGTKSEMERMIADANRVKEANGEMADLSIDSFADVTEAIHIIQEEMGITGTTAKEAEETVTGSFTMMKASVLNFLQQLGNPGADMDKFTKAMLDSIGIFIGNVKRVLATIWDNLPLNGLQKKLLVAAAAFGPVLLAAGKVVSTVGSIITKANGAIPVIKNFASGFSSAGTAMAQGAPLATKLGAAIGGISAPVIAVVAVIAALVAAFVTLWKTNEDFRNKIKAIWDEIVGKFKEAGQKITDAINSLGFNFKDIVDVLKSAWLGLCNFIGPIFIGLFKEIGSIIMGIVDIVTGVVQIVSGIIKGFKDGDWSLFLDGLKTLFTGFINLILAPLKGWFETFKGYLEQFGVSWDETWTSIKEFFVDIWNGITSFFSNVINAIKTAVSNFVTTIINFFAQLPTNIANFITSAYNSVVTWASNMVAKAREMGQNFLNAVVSFFTNLPYKVGYFIGNTLTNIVIWVDNMVDKAREMGTNFLNQVVAFFTQLPGKVLQFITSAFNNVQTWATNMVNKAREMGTNFINNVVSFFTQLPGKVLQFITSAFNNVQTWAVNMANKASEMGTNFINNVVSFMQQLPGKIEYYLNSAITKLATWVTQMGQKGTEAVQSLINNVTSAASGIASTVMSIGTDIVTGVWNGIQNAAGWFTARVKSFFSGIVNSVKRALGIGSPSKVFRDEIGKWLPPGVVQGFEAAMPSAMKAIQKVLNKGINNIDTDDISVGAGITVSGFADKLKSIYNEVALWFESIESRIGNSVDSMMQSLDMLIRAGHAIVNSDGTLGYIGYNGFTKPGGSEGYVDRTNPKDKDNGGNGDTFIFNSPRPIDEIEAAKQMKKTKQDMAEGF